MTHIAEIDELVEWRERIGVRLMLAMPFMAQPYADHPDYRDEWAA